MDTYCLAFNCKNYIGEKSGFSAHKFPLDPELRKRWIEAIKRKGFVPSDSSILCSAHFEESAFENEGSEKRLKKDAIPTLFDSPFDLEMSEPKKERICNKLTDTDNQQEKEVPDEEISVEQNISRDQSSRSPIPGSSQGKINIKTETDDLDDPNIAEPNFETHFIKEEDLEEETEIFIKEEELEEEPESPTSPQPSTSHLSPAYGNATNFSLASHTRVSQQLSSSSLVNTNLNSKSTVGNEMNGFTPGLLNPRAAAIFSLLAMTYVLKKKKDRRKPRSCWVKGLCKQRQQDGNYPMREVSVNHVNDIVANLGRILPEDFDYLESLIGPKIARLDTFMRKAITVKERLALTLTFLVTGDSYASMSSLFKVSTSSISKIIPEVCAAIIETLQDYVKIPSSTEEWMIKSEEFEEKCSFPHAIAAMDGRHVSLQVPHSINLDYNNQTNSLTVFALVDADYNFLYVDVGSQEQTTDNDVFKSMTLNKKLEKQELHIPHPVALRIPYVIEVPYFILCDKTFALSDNILTPFEGDPEKSSSEQIFNYRHSRVYNVVENALGVLGSVFRILRKPILLQPEVASKVVVATIYLHNFLRNRPSREIYSPEGTFDSESKGEIISGCWRNDYPMTSFLPLCNIPPKIADQTNHIRLHLAQHFALNDVLPWQNISK